MPNNKDNKIKGFTLIELLAVIIILGIILLLAVPGIGRYIEKSRSGVYINNAKEIISVAKREIDSLAVAPLPNAEISIFIPLSKLPLEKGKLRSSFGNYVQDKCYVAVLYDEGRFVYYINLIDESGHGLVMVPEDNLNTSSIAKQADELAKVKSFPEIISSTGSLKTNGFQYKYIKTSNDIIVVAVTYPTFYRGQEVELLDGSKWIVLSLEDEDTNKTVNVVSKYGYDGSSGTGYQSPSKIYTMKDLLLANVGSMVQLARNNLIQGGVRLDLATIKLPTLQEFCPGLPENTRPTIVCYGYADTDNQHRTAGNFYDFELPQLLIRSIVNNYVYSIRDRGLYATQYSNIESTWGSVHLAINDLLKSNIKTE